MRQPPVAAALVALAGSVSLLAAWPAGPASAGDALRRDAVAPLAGEIADSPDLDERLLRDLVADAQRLLNLRGYDAGPVDGQFGWRTQRAIRAYQDAARDRGYLEALNGPVPADRVAEGGAVPSELTRLEPASGPKQ